MNHKKIKKQIKKISSFFESITADDEISKIERDLLLSYISKLYESVLDHEENEVAKPRKKVKQTQADPEPVEAKKEVSVPTPARKPFERAEAVEPTIIEEVIAPIAQETTATAIRTETVAIKETVVESSSPVHVEPSKPEISEKMASIFKHDGGTELSDKLGNLPIKDLTKSMGINERMFTIKELFGGNQERFKSVMQAINTLSGYDEAKEYLLSGVATELHWDSEDNYKKADKFVKLVQRRFS